MSDRRPAHEADDAAAVEEAAPPARSFNHFGLFSLTADYWRLDEPARARLREDWVPALASTADAVHHYVTYPAEATSDILIWSAVEHSPDSTARFFDAHSVAVRPFRRYVRPVDSLWGFTRASQYSRARSRQEIDPFQGRAMPWLVMYPFTKTTEWYLLPADVRQSMMNDHIRVGKQYRSITQLLLYSMGVQDHEFVVVYETDDLPLFSSLVSDLRQTEARIHTKADTPVRTARYRSVGDPGDLWP